MPDGLGKTEMLIKVAAESGQSLDLLALLSDGLDSKAFAIFCGNAETLPLYIKSSETP